MFPISKTVPFYTAGTPTANTKLNHQMITICMSQEQSGNIADKAFEKLMIELTMEENQMFLYRLCLTEPDFLRYLDILTRPQLKSQQQLQISFAQFPEWFVQLLGKASASSEPQYMLFLSQTGLGSCTAPATLDIIQPDQYQRLVRLSLQFIPATDDQLREYMAEWITKLKSHRSTLERHVRNVEADLANRSEELERNRLEAKNNDSLHTQQLARLNEEHEQRFSYAHRKWEQEKQQMNDQFESQHHELREQITRLVDEKQVCEDSPEVNDRLAAEQRKYAEVDEEASTLEAERNSLEARLEQSVRENIALKAEVDRLTERVQLHESAVNENGRLVSHKQALCDHLLEQKRRLEENLDRKKDYIDKLKAALADQVEQLQKLEARLKVSEEKRRMCYEVTANMQRDLDAKQTELSDKCSQLEISSKSNENVKSELDAARADRTKLENELATLKERLEKSSKDLETKSTCADSSASSLALISYLNSQVTALQSHQRSSPVSFGNSGSSVHPYLQRPTAAVFRPISNLSTGSSFVDGLTAVLPNPAVDMRTVPSDDSLVDPLHPPVDRKYLEPKPAGSPSVRDWLKDGSSPAVARPAALELRSTGASLLRLRNP